MEIKKGIGVSPGVVISTAVVLDAEDLVIPKRSVSPDQVDAELKRFGEAVAQAIDDVSKLRDAMTAEIGKDIGSIFDFHIGLLKDKTLIVQITGDIKSHHTTAEYSVSIAMRRYANTVAAIKDKYLSERV